MSTASQIPADQLSPLADAETQRFAARLAQDIFAEVFRKAFTPDPEQLGKALRELEAKCVDFYMSGSSDEAKALRLALLVSGLDQWGLAYTQAFKLTAIPALTALLGSLRSRLNAQSDALFQQNFNRLDLIETDAIDFKVELRRAIHLALWHAMAACDSADEAAAIVQTLGSLMLALDQRMPNLGWRLLADALAHIQIGLLRDTDQVSDIAREGTQQLFAALRHALPLERYQNILSHSSQAMLAWQQARRQPPAA